MEKEKKNPITEKVHTLNSYGKDFFRLGIKALLSKAVSVPWANGSLQFENTALPLENGMFSRHVSL